MDELQSETTAVPIGDTDHDSLYDVLSHPYRRFILRSLGDGNVTTRSALAAELESWQANRNATTRPVRTNERIEIDLYHIHLPKMAEADVIEYNPQSGRTVMASDFTISW